MILRDAVSDDADAIAALYGHYVRTSPATFEEEPPDTAEIRNRLKRVQDAGLPWRAGIEENNRLIGYAYASPYRTRSAYRYTLESSVYVSPDYLRRGIGSVLMRDLIERCAPFGYRQMLAVIGDSTNEPSIRMHARLGFALIGTHPAVGFKFGRWIDVVHMQLALGGGARSTPSR